MTNTQFPKSTKFTFGKYKGQSFEEIKKMDPEYIQYMAVNYGDKFVDVLDFATDNHMLDCVFIPFGKYKNQTVSDVMNNDKKYLTWFVNMLESSEKISPNSQRVIDEFHRLE